MKYSLYQVNFTDEQARKINTGFDEESDKLYKAYLDTQFGKLDQALEMKLYKKVAEIEAEDLEDVFRVGNLGPESKITRIAPMHSVSVGDIVVLNGEANVVASCGFDPVSNFEEE